MVILLCLWLAGSLLAQQPPVHYWHHGSMPPGAIGSRQLQRGGPLPGFFQPVMIKAPAGVLVSLAEGGGFPEVSPTPVTAGLLIGQVYRFRVMNIPNHAGLEVFPTIEVIDRLYAPPDQAQRFPIVVALTIEDLRYALQGKFVTRVIYLEDPQWAVPYKEPPEGQNWFEVGAGKDPLAIADELGRPVAILRMGARLPGEGGVPSLDFLFGCPPVVKYAPADETPQGAEPTPAEAVQQASLRIPRR
jgi:hypothetical protein